MGPRRIRGLDVATPRETVAPAFLSAHFGVLQEFNLATDWRAPWERTMLRPRRAHSRRRAAAVLGRRNARRQNGSVEEFCGRA